jgi:pilus assembly protein Flp/PilA
MIDYTRRLIAAIAKDESGLTAVEYAVLGGIIVAALGLIGTAFTGELTTAFANLIK